MRQNIKANVDFIGQIPEFSEIGTGDRSDFRPVPSSDDGERYDDRGMLGSYTPTSEPFGAPDGVKYDSGFGMEAADAVRGYMKPAISDDPAYELQNYVMRSTQPKLYGSDGGSDDALSNDYEFRRKNERSRGFLTRPHIPTDR